MASAMVRSGGWVEAAGCGRALPGHHVEKKAFDVAAFEHARMRVSSISGGALPR